MHYLLMVVEPLGQRAERGRAGGEAAYAAMREFADTLQTEGVLLGVNSLASPAQRVQRRDGATRLVDGPFAEAREMIGGYFLVEVGSREAAVALAARCPAAEWCSVEVREVGPCWT